jgi:hypothetical protein
MSCVPVVDRWVDGDSAVSLARRGGAEIANRCLAIRTALRGMAQRWSVITCLWMIPLVTPLSLLPKQMTLLHLMSLVNRVSPVSPVSTRPAGRIATMSPPDPPVPGKQR